MGGVYFWVHYGEIFNIKNFSQKNAVTSLIDVKSLINFTDPAKSELTPQIDIDFWYFIICALRGA